MDPDDDRGTCPACGSADVLLVVHGLPTPELAARPDVRIAGCVVVDDADLECARCGTAWSSPGV